MQGKLDYSSMFRAKKAAKSQLFERKVRAGEAFREVMGHAKKCMATDVFSDYKRRYFEVRQQLLEDMINFKEPDPMKYAFAVGIMADRIRSMGVLLQDLEYDSTEAEK